MNLDRTPTLSLAGTPAEILTFINGRISRPKGNVNKFFSFGGEKKFLLEQIVVNEERTIVARFDNGAVPPGWDRLEDCLPRLEALVAAKREEEIEAAADANAKAEREAEIEKANRVLKIEIPTICDYRRLQSLENRLEAIKKAKCVDVIIDEDGIERPIERCRVVDDTITSRWNRGEGVQILGHMKWLEGQIRWQTFEDRRLERERRAAEMTCHPQGRVLSEFDREEARRKQAERKARVRARSAEDYAIRQRQPRPGAQAGNKKSPAKNGKSAKR